MHYISGIMSNLFTSLPENSIMLPRYDLREPAFRRYESIIAEAVVKGSTTVDPQAMEMKTSTFIARFRDAVRGYRHYHYESSKIPSNIAFELRLEETTTGLVHIKNVIAKTSPPFSRDHVLQTCRDLANKTIQGPVYFEVPQEADRLWLSQMADPMSETFIDIALSWDGIRVKII